MEAGHKDTALLIYASSNFSRGNSPVSVEAEQHDSHFDIESMVVPKRDGGFSHLIKLTGRVLNVSVLVTARTKVSNLPESDATTIQTLKDTSTEPAFTNPATALTLEIAQRLNVVCVEFQQSVVLGGIEGLGSHLEADRQPATTRV